MKLEKTKNTFQAHYFKYLHTHTPLCLLSCNINILLLGLYWGCLSDLPSFLCKSFSCAKMEKFAIFGMSGAFLIAVNGAAFAYSPTVNDIVSFLNTVLNNHLQMALLQGS